jgi:hypothetical protein
LADALCFQPEHNALLAIQRVRTRQSTGEDMTHQTLVVIDVNHVVGVEFENTDCLAALGLKAPPLPDKPHYTAGSLIG